MWARSLSEVDLPAEPSILTLKQLSEHKHCHDHGDLRHQTTKNSLGSCAALGVSGNDVGRNSWFVPERCPCQAVPGPFLASDGSPGSPELLPSSAEVSCSKGF